MKIYLLHLYRWNFSWSFNTAEVGRLYKKKKRTDKNNYRPVGILSNFSKIYESSFYNQMFDYFDRICPKYQSGFTKGTVCLLYVIEKIKQAKDNNNVFAAVLQACLKLLIVLTMSFSLLNPLSVSLPSYRN